MAGLGFKDFQVGEVLTSSDVDGYLMAQAVMRFADSGARGSALGTATGTAVALAEGMVSYLDSTERVEVYDGSGWRPVSGVVQVLSATSTAAQLSSVATGSWTDVTGLSVTITPTTADNKIVVMASVSGGQTSATTGQVYQLLRDATAIGLGDAASNRRQVTASTFDGDADTVTTQSFSVVDSPATTSAVTYKVQVGHTAGGSANILINRSRNDTDTALYTRNSSTLIVMEVE